MVGAVCLACAGGWDPGVCGVCQGQGAPGGALWENAWFEYLMASESEVVGSFATWATAHGYVVGDLGCVRG